VKSCLNFSYSCLIILIVAVVECERGASWFDLDIFSLLVIWWSHDLREGSTSCQHHPKTLRTFTHPFWVRNLFQYTTVTIEQWALIGYCLFTLSWFGQFGQTMGTGHCYFDEMRSSFNLIQNQHFALKKLNIC
jgi:hypothetical protein